MRRNHSFGVGAQSNLDTEWSRPYSDLHKRLCYILEWQSACLWRYRFGHNPKWSESHACAVNRTDIVTNWRNYYELRKRFDEGQLIANYKWNTRLSFITKTLYISKKYIYFQLVADFRDLLSQCLIKKLTFCIWSSIPANLSDSQWRLAWIRTV